MRSRKAPYQKNKMIDESGSVLDFVLHPNPVRNALASGACNKMF